MSASVDVALLPAGRGHVICTPRTQFSASYRNVTAYGYMLAWEVFGFLIFLVDMRSAYCDCIYFQSKML